MWGGKVRILQQCWGGKTAAPSWWWPWRGYKGLDSGWILKGEPRGFFSRLRRSQERCHDSSLNNCRDGVAIDGGGETASGGFGWKAQELSLTHRALGAVPTVGGWKEEKEFLEAEWRKYIEEEGAVEYPLCTAE